MSATFCYRQKKVFDAGGRPEGRCKEKSVVSRLGCLFTGEGRELRFIRDTQIALERVFEEDDVIGKSQWQNLLLKVETVFLASEIQEEIREVHGRRRDIGMNVMLVGLDLTIGLEDEQVFGGDVVCGTNNKGFGVCRVGITNSGRLVGRSQQGCCS